MKMFLLAVLLSSVFAQDKLDRIILQSGGEIVGTVITEDSTTIKINVAFASGGSGEMVFGADEVRRIDRASADRAVAKERPINDTAKEKRKADGGPALVGGFIAAASVEEFRKLKTPTLQDAIKAFGKNYIIGPAHPSSGTDAYSLFKNRQKYYVWRNKDGTGVAMKKEETSDSIYLVMPLR